jgi:hypothetical protein
MRNADCNSFQLGIIMLLLLPMPALATSAITCHCFTDRFYNAERPAAADPYLLATTQNSFFAVVFNTDKKTIVIKKQQGTSSDDLWIAFWVAPKRVYHRITCCRSSRSTGHGRMLWQHNGLLRKPWAAAFQAL